MRYSFNDVTIDLSRFELLREGSPQPIQPRVLDLLIYLIRHRKRVVSRDELLQEVWRGITVSNAALSQAIMEARRSVGDAADIQDVIRTVRGRGYQVVAEVKEFDVVKIPLIVVLNGDGEELGEIVENPPEGETLEESLFKILRKA